MEKALDAQKLMNLLEQKFKRQIRNLELTESNKLALITGLLFEKEFKISADFETVKPEIISISNTRIVNDALKNFITETLGDKPLYYCNAKTGKNVLFTACWNSKKILKAQEDKILDDIAFQNLALSDYKPETKILSFVRVQENANKKNSGFFIRENYFDDLNFHRNDKEKVKILSFTPNSDRNFYTNAEFEKMKQEKKAVKIKYAVSFNRPQFFAVDSSLYILDKESQNSNPTLKKVTDVEFAEPIVMNYNNIYIYCKSEDGSLKILERELFTNESSILKEQLRKNNAFDLKINTPTPETLLEIKQRQIYELNENKETKTFQAPQGEGFLSYSNDYFKQNYQVLNKNNIIQRLHHSSNLNFPNMIRYNSKSGPDYYLYFPINNKNDSFRKIDKIQINKTYGNALATFFLKPFPTEKNAPIINKIIEDVYYVNYFLQILKNEKFVLIESSENSIKKESSTKKNQSTQEKI